MSWANGMVVRFTHMRRTIRAMITHGSVQWGTGVMFLRARAWPSVDVMTWARGPSHSADRRAWGAAACWRSSVNSLIT
jgi:hypothetical protein